MSILYTRPLAWAGILSPFRAKEPDDKHRWQNDVVELELGYIHFHYPGTGDDGAAGVGRDFPAEQEVLSFGF